MTAVPSPSAGLDRKPVSLRLSAPARAILARLSYEQGISQAGVVELLLRHADRENGTGILPFGQRN